jgi:hypothetical protein
VGYVMRKNATLAGASLVARPTTAPTTAQSVSAR